MGAYRACTHTCQSSLEIISTFTTKNADEFMFTQGMQTGTADC